MVMVVVVVDLPLPMMATPIWSLMIAEERGVWAI